MITLCVAILAVFTTTAASNHASFDEWLRSHQLTGRWNTAELEQRKAIFLANVNKIVDHNANPDRRYSMGLNKFSASTPSELKAMNGAVPEMITNHQSTKLRKSSIALKDVSDLPKSIDWRERGVVSPVKNQGHCGSCWAFSTTESLESHVAIETGVLFSMSPQQIASCTQNPDECGGTGGCSGGMPQVAFDNVANYEHGITEEFQYPYNSYFGKDFECSDLTNSTETPTAVATIEGYVQVTPNNYQELMNVVAFAGPVSIVLDASTFHSYEKGIFDGCDPNAIELDHAVQLVGYGEEDDGTKYWLVRNSWSPSWGEGGYIRILRRDNDDSNCDFTSNGGRCKGEPLKANACGTCGIMYSPSYPTGGKLYDGDHPIDP